MVTLPKVFVLISISKNSPTTPALHATPVWANPRSLATTWGIIVYFLFLRVLRCFSSPGWPPFGYLTSSQVGCPIRISQDQCSCAAPLSFSQLTTSFFASCRLGIRHTPLFALNINHNIQGKYVPLYCIDIVYCLKI